jgi:peptidoglycan/LPS O-acetylase OafA/YrhL
VRAHSAILCTGVLMWCIAPRQLWLSPDRALSLAPLRAIGRISYGLYLYHLPIYHALLLPAAGPATVALAIALTFAVATASYWLVERPILRYAARFRHRKPDR